jgi:hypothetical protein
MLPARLPGVLGRVEYGTRVAIGFPRLVIVTGVRVAATSSRTFKHRSLNSPAGILGILAI